LRSVEIPKEPDWAKLDIEGGQVRGVEYRSAALVMEMTIIVKNILSEDVEEMRLNVGSSGLAAISWRTSVTPRKFQTTNGKPVPIVYNPSGAFKLSTLRTRASYDTENGLDEDSPEVQTAVLYEDWRMSGSSIRHGGPRGARYCHGSNVISRS